jgi:HPt (histidine-containing phosphotransfer) domain-containing protein
MTAAAQKAAASLRQGCRDTTQTRREEMTIKELYEEIGGNYDQAVKIMKLDKLIDRHIRKFTNSAMMENMRTAAVSMDAMAMFESAHAMKGVCANLGLVRLSELASELAEEFRPGTARSLSDDEVRGKVEAIGELYKNTTDGILRYAEG